MSGRITRNTKSTSSVEKAEASQSEKGQNEASVDSVPKTPEHTPMTTDDDQNNWGDCVEKDMGEIDGEKGESDEDKVLDSTMSTDDDESPISKGGEDKKPGETSPKAAQQTSDGETSPMAALKPKSAEEKTSPKAAQQVNPDAKTGNPDDIDRQVDAIFHSIKHLQTSNDDYRMKIRNIQTPAPGGSEGQKTIDGLKQEIRDLETRLKAAETSQKQIEDQLKATQKENQTLTKTNDDLGKKLTEAEAMNNELLKTILENEPPKAETKQKQKQKVLLIGDSNVKRSKHLLNKEEVTWSATTTIYTVRDLTKWMKATDQRLTDLAKEQDQVIIHLGTNDLRDGTKEADVYEGLINAAETIQSATNKPVHIAEIPPMKIHNRIDLGAKSAILNTRIRTTTNTKISPVLLTDQYKQLTSDDLLDRDGFHLSNKGQKVLKEELEKTALLTNKQGEPQLDEISIDLKPEMVKHVVGKQGKTKDHLENQHRARITIINDAGKSTIKLKGQTGDINQAKKAIDEILRTIQVNNKTKPDKKSEETNPPKSGKPCPYFAKGNCRFGSKCRNVHTSENSERKRPRPQTPAQTNSTARTESKSPPRKRDNRKSLNKQTPRRTGDHQSRASNPRGRRTSSPNLGANFYSVLE